MAPSFAFCELRSLAVTSVAGTPAEDLEALEDLIQKMRMEKLMWADLQARAAQPPGTPGRLKPGAMAKLRRLVEDGTDLFDGVEKLEDEGELTEEALPPQVPGLGGPAAPAGPPGPIPSLEALQGMVG
jgi:hypothetical protein